MLSLCFARKKPAGLPVKCWKWMPAQVKRGPPCPVNRSPGMRARENLGGEGGQAAEDGFGLSLLFTSFFGAEAEKKFHPGLHLLQLPGRCGWGEALEQ